MRKVKRILLKIEIALRCYADRPLDASLLVFLAFQDEIGGKLQEDFLPRSFLTPKKGAEMMHKKPDQGRGPSNKAVGVLNEAIRNSGPELLDLPRDSYRLPDDQSYYPWAMIFSYLAKHYVPSHQDVLNAVAEVTVPAE